MNWILIKLNDDSLVTGQASGLRMIDNFITVYVPECDRLKKHKLSIPLASIKRIYEINEEQSLVIQQDISGKYNSWDAWCFFKVRTID